MIVRKSLFAVLALALAGVSPADSKGGGISNPAAKYLPPVVVDADNDAVPAAEKGAKPGTPGGRLRIRTKGDFQHMNTLTVTGQPEKVIINCMTDSLVDRDPGTLEYYPEMAWGWRETDTIKRKGGAEEFGRILEQNDQTVTFVPGAWKETYGNYELADISEKEQMIQLRPDRGGRRIDGAITRHLYTVTVDTGLAPDMVAKKQVIPVSELETWTDAIGEKKRERVWAKPNCAFEFMLRSEASWSDGKPFTAEDIKFSYELIMNTTVDCAQIRNYFMDVTSCEIIENGTAVRFVCKKPFFQQLDFLAGTHSTSYFIPKYIIKPEQYGGDEKTLGEAFNNADFKEKPVYTGAYKFKEWRRGDILTIERNPNYWKNKLPDGAIAKWKKGMPYMDQISWVTYKEEASSVKDLANKNLDVDYEIEPPTWNSPDTNSEAFKAACVRSKHKGFLYTYIGWNLTNPLFADPEVRKALAMLIPAENIATNVHEGLAFPVSGPAYSDGPCYDKEIKPVPYDPKAAKAILRKAGFLDRDRDGVIEKKVDGKDVPFAFNYMIHNMKDYHQKVADIIKESLSQAGIQITIEKNDWTIYAKKTRDKQFDAVRFAWGNDVDSDVFQMFHSSQIENKGDNYISYRNEKADELMEKAREEFDPEKRWAMNREIHKILADTQTVCFHLGFEECLFYNKALRGVIVYANQYPYDFTEWYWSEVPENRK